MAQIALVLLGEGQAYYKGELMQGKEAMDKAGISLQALSPNPLTYLHWIESADAVEFQNGENFITNIDILSGPESSVFIWNMNNPKYWL